MKKIPRKKAWLTLILLIILFFLFPLGVVKLAVIAIPFATIDQPTHITFYDQNNQKIASYVQGEISDYQVIEDINPLLIKCVVHSEDKNFYTHSGFDYKRIIKAMYVNLVSSDIEQGASTISQQVSRTLFFDLQKSFSRKVKEAFVAMQLEHHYSKDKIIEIYLNTVFFGKDIYGIEAISQFYFHKSQSELNLFESALVASLLNSPNKYINDDTNQQIFTRTLNLLSSLYKAKKITSEEYAEATSFEGVIYKDDTTVFDNSISYYLDGVITYLTTIGVYCQENILQGMKIYTNFHPLRHQMAINALNSQITNLEDLQTSIVLMKPNSNAVEVLIGGKDYLDSAYNRPLVAKRQIGSTIKPLLYYLALVNGCSPLSKLMSEPTIFDIDGFGQYSPTNYGDLYANRQINMLEAIAMSDNIYAVKMGLYLGTATLAKSLANFVEVKEVLPSIVLGTTEMTLLELAAIYNMFASLGKYYPPRLVRHVTNYQNELIYQSDNYYVDYLDEPYTMVLNQMLRAPFDPLLKTYGTPTMMNYTPQGYYSAKSGSTISDSYVMAYNPHVTIAIWSGNEQGEVMNSTNISKVLFRLIAHQIDLKDGITWYQPLPSLEVKRIDPLSGLLSSSGSVYYFY